MGWPGGILKGGDWGKPKGMHWRIYQIAPWVGPWITSTVSQTVSKIG